MLKNRIKEFRVLNNLTQERLGELIYTSQPQIKRLESDERKIPPEWLERLAGGLNINPLRLIADDEYLSPLAVPGKDFINNALLGEVMAAIEEFFLKSEKTPPIGIKSKWVAILYDHAIRKKTTVTSEEIKEHIKTMAASQPTN